MEYLLYNNSSSNILFSMASNGVYDSEIYSTWSFWIHTVRQISKFKYFCTGLEQVRYNHNKSNEVASSYKQNRARALLRGNQTGIGINSVLKSLFTASRCYWYDMTFPDVTHVPCRPQHQVSNVVEYETGVNGWTASQRGQGSETLTHCV